MNKSAVIQFKELTFTPRFEYGDMAGVAVVTGNESDTELGTGFARFTNAKIPWTVQYDEVLVVIEGSIQIRIDGETLTASAKDSVWLPKGTTLIYESESALVFYAIHPSNWAENLA